MTNYWWHKEQPNFELSENGEIQEVPVKEFDVQSYEKQLKNELWAKLHKNEPLPKPETNLPFWDVQDIIATAYNENETAYRKQDEKRIKSEIISELTRNYTEEDAERYVCDYFTRKEFEKIELEKKRTDAIFAKIRDTNKRQAQIEKERRGQEYTYKNGQTVKLETSSTNYFEKKYNTGGLTGKERQRAGQLIRDIRDGNILQDSPEFEQLDQKTGGELSDRLRYQEAVYGYNDSKHYVDYTGELGRKESDIIQERIEKRKEKKGFWNWFLNP